ncbi:MAG TPA: cytochrome c [Sphingomonadaceae bacterium]|jgi:mono/diheme cytochrome c family protein|nr:cytochrome c [Sphingomonadaceae bacterium]
MKITSLLLGLALSGSAVAVAAAGSQAAKPLDGKALFGVKCGMCHRADGMGTGLLARRMDPKIAELEKRTDLTPDYVTQAARTGIGNMPQITRGEVSDPQMAAIAAYLAKGNK